MKSSWKRLAAAGALTLALAGGGVLATSGTALAASAACNSTSTFHNAAGYVYHRPTAGTETHQTNCELDRASKSEGDGVRLLQQTMNQCYKQGLTVDGIFGPKTEAALRYVQQHYLGFTGAEVDGKFGPMTGGAMHWSLFDTVNQIPRGCGH